VTWGWKIKLQWEFYNFYYSPNIIRDQIKEVELDEVCNTRMYNILTRKSEGKEALLMH
jgi:hypothetical protein